MKKIIATTITLVLIVGYVMPVFAAGDPTLGKLLGDVSCGNHPLAGLDGTDIIVPRPTKSQYEPIAVLDTSNVKLTDISGHWAEASIKKFVEKGYIAGYEDGTFRPDNPVNYAEFATIVARMNIKPVIFNGGIEPIRTVNFNKDKWYYNAFMIANEAGLFGNILTGTVQFLESGLPSYKQTVDDALREAQRQYVALYISNMLEYQESERNNELSYKDVTDIDKNADYTVVNAIKRMVANDIITGYSDGTFKPQDTITRAELVTILTRVLDKYQWNMHFLHDNLYGNYNKYYWEQSKITIQLVNEERKSKGLNTLEYDPNLQALAEIKSIDFYVNDYFAHESSIYGLPYDMSPKFGYISYVGENITTTYASGQSCYDSWRYSEKHHENYMNKNYTVIGCAINESGSVQMLGNPKLKTK